MDTRRSLTVCLGFILSITLSTILLAQEGTGRIIGTIYDQTGAVLTGARVVVTNTATDISRNTISDQNGSYQVAALPIGTYRIAVDHQGFNPITTNPIKLEINQSAKVDVKLQVGNETQVLTVESSGATVETVNPTLGSTVSEREIANAPLNGRNALDLVLLQPGVLPADNQGNGGAGSANTRFSIGGGRNDSNTFLLDGGVNNDLLDNGVVYNPNPDAIQEFRVLTSNFTAEYGRNSGGIITVVTKSGTNAFHGSGFEYNRNTAYNANTFLNNATPDFNNPAKTVARPVLKRNQFGGSIGGPIVKNKLFFFFSYQGQRESQIVPTDVGITFTPAELKGDFSQSATQSSVAAFLQANPFFQSNAALAAQGIIDSTKIDPVARAYIKAGLVPSSANGNISFQNPAKDNRDEQSAKFDFAATSKDHISVTVGRQHQSSLGLGVGGSGFVGAPGPSQFVGTNEAHRQFLNLGYAHILSQTMLNEFHMTAQRVDSLQAAPAQKLGAPSSFGSNITPDNPTAPPLLTFPSLTLGFSPQGPSELIDNTFTYADTVSWTHGKHTIKFGGGYSAFQDNQVFDFFVDGNFDFVPSIDGVNAFATGDAFANFLVGVPDFLFQAPAAPSNIRSKSTNIFAQDEWHVASNLVLTLGLRYEYNTPKFDTQGRTFSIVPGAQSTVFPHAPVGVLFPGDKGAPTGANFPRKTDFAPRFGFAWQPFHDSKTSIRGGTGLFYDVLKAEDNFQFNGQFPFASTAFIGFNDPSGSAAPFGLVTNPFVATGSTNPFPSKPVDHNIDFASNVGTFGGGGVFFVDPNLRTPYTYQYNLSIEQELAQKLLFQAAYVGSSSHGLTGLKDINPFDPKTLGGTPNRLLNETSGNVNGSLGFLPQFMNLANANYNALQLSVRQQSTAVPILGTVYYTFGYTWSHSIDGASGFRNNNSQVPFFQPNLFRASSDFDLRHVVTFSGGWDLPFNRGPKKLVQGWSLYPIITWRTGYPYTITAGLNALNGTPGPSGAGDGNLVNANLVSPVRFIDPHSKSSPAGASGFFFFDPTSFSSSVASGYGTAPRNLLRGFGRTNMDLSLAKTVPVYGDHVSLKFNVDAFNVLNHTEFSRLGLNAASGSLGKVTRTYDPRILQLGAHITF